MAKTWVLDTESKGTGAHVSPLRDDAKAEVEPDLALVTLERPARPPAQSGEISPLSFKVVDVLGARVLGENIDARAAVELLAGMRSVLDARIYVRQPTSGRWRLLTLAEQKTLWSFRPRANAA